MTSVAVLSRRLEGGGGGAAALVDALRGLGWETEEVPDRPELPTTDVVLLRGTTGWYPRTMSALRHRVHTRGPLVAAWWSEPLPHPAAVGARAPRRHAREVVKVVLRDPRAVDPRTNLRRAVQDARSGTVDLTLVTGAGWVETLAEHGVESTWLPAPQHLAPTPENDAVVERDIPVLFLGSLDVPRRRRAVASLRREGVPLVALGDWRDPRLWGEERRLLLQRVVVMLNLSRFRGQAATPRLALAAAHGCATLSEPMLRPDPFVAGRDFVEAALEEMPQVVAELLGDGAARRSVVAAARTVAERELAVDVVARRLVALLEPRLQGNV